MSGIATITPAKYPEPEDLKHIIKTANEAAISMQYNAHIHESDIIILIPNICQPPFEYYFRSVVAKGAGSISRNAWMSFFFKRLEVRMDGIGTDVHVYHNNSALIAADFNNFKFSIYKPA